MKKVLYLFFILGVLVFASCGEQYGSYDGDPMYLNFERASKKITVLPNVTKYNVVISLLGPATEDVTFSLDVLETTDPDGDRFTFASNLSQMKIAKGEIFTNVVINADVNNYAGESDQVKLKVKTSSVPTVLADSVVVSLQPFCPAILDDFVGTYNEYDPSDGTVYPQVVVEVTHVSNDTLLFTMTSDAALFIGPVWSDAQPFKATLTYSAEENVLAVINEQPIFTHSTYGQVYLYNVNSDGARLFGSADYCDGVIAIPFSLMIPGVGSFNPFMAYFKKN